METFRIVLPIIWVFVATIVGWFLYRKGEAKVETKWALFTGAAAIAAVCFYGLNWATMQSFEQCGAPGDSLVRASDIQRLRSLSQGGRERIVTAREACTASPRRDDRCVEALDGLAEQEVRVTEGLGRLDARH